MNIYGLGFDSTKQHGYEGYFGKRLESLVDSMKLSDTVPADAEVLVVNLTGATGQEIFGAIMPDEKVYKIFIISEMRRSVLPFLKLADFIVYTNDFQRRIVEDLLRLKFNSTVLPLPGGDFETADQNDFLVYFDLAVTEDLEEYMLKNFDEPSSVEKLPQSDVYHFLFSCEDDALFDSLVEKGQAICEEKIADTDENKDFNAEYRFYNSKNMDMNEIRDLIKISSKCQYLKREMDLDQYEDFMGKRTGGMLYEVLVDSPVLADLTHANVEMLDYKDITAVNHSKGLKATYEDWANLITSNVEAEYEKSLAEKQGHLDDLEFDTLDDVIIEHGAPLDNEYIFSICFRNQEEKIQRCIESIAEQNRDFDFGVVLVNDCSTDKSIEKILESVEKTGVNACVVTNKNRNCAARNFYNVVHLYTTNEEAVIIEVDGDDFLHGTEVLETLDKYYKAGALKTNGSYKMYPDGQEFMNEEDVVRNHALMDYNNPWNIDLCNAWLHLRTSKRKLIKKVEINHFLDRNTHTWLTDRHDAALQPRIIELAEGKAVFVEEVLYNYDISGDNHDHDNTQWEEEHLKLYGHLNKIYHPLIVN